MYPCTNDPKEISIDELATRVSVDLGLHGGHTIDMVTIGLYPKSTSKEQAQRVVNNVQIVLLPLSIISLINTMSQPMP